MEKSIVVLAVIAIATSGCASMGIGEHWKPVIDKKSIGVKTMVEVATDLSECQEYAREVDPARQALTLGALGAVAGAVLGTIAGGRSFAHYGANYGAAAGIGTGAGQGIRTQQDIIKNCMNGRGYRVLN